MSKKNPRSRAPDLDKYIKQSKKHRYVSYYQGAQLYNMGYSLFVRTAKLAGANLPIRKTTIVDLNILDDYLEQQAKIKEKEEMDKDDAIIMMVDANIQREEILPSEKAFAYKMKLDAVKRQAGKPTKMSLAVKIIPPKSGGI